MRGFQRLPRIALALPLTVLLFGCRSSSQPKALQPSVLHPKASQAGPALPVRADQTNAPLLPDTKLTPGATLPVTKEDICVPGYSRKVRNVPASVKRQAYAAYGIASHKPGEYEVDHLISLELGGSNSIKNLWPESYLTQPWNARVKDQLENKMHDEICSGRLDMKTAQHEIATDWITAYKKYFHTDRPLSKAPKSLPADPDMAADNPKTPINLKTPMTHPLTQDGAVKVWVNTGSGKYFFPGAKYYGKTKRGEYLTEAEAKAQGFVAAGQQAH